MGAKPVSLRIKSTSVNGVELDGGKLKQVEQFKYLGIIFVGEGGCKGGMSKRDV